MTSVQSGYLTEIAIEPLLMELERISGMLNSMIQKAERFQPVDHVNEEQADYLKQGS
jgi:hypothetical protein